MTEGSLVPDLSLQQVNGRVVVAVLRLRKMWRSRSPFPFYIGNGGLTTDPLGAMPITPMLLIGQGGPSASGLPGDVYIDSESGDLWQMV